MLKALARLTNWILSEEPEILDSEITPRAEEKYWYRKSKNIPGSAESDWSYAKSEIKQERINSLSYRAKLAYRSKQMLAWLIQPNKNIIKPIALVLENSSWFKIFEKVGFLTAFIVFILQVSDRGEQAKYDAWALIYSAGTGRGSGSGKMEALEYLSKGCQSKKTFGENPITNLIFGNCVQFYGIELPNDFLFDINMRYAKLGSANLQKTDLRQADLRGVDLSMANLRCSKLNFVRLEKADLRQSDVRGANLEGAQLSESNFTLARLEGANLYGSHLDKSILSGTNFGGAILSGSTFHKANLDNVRFNNAVLVGVNLSNLNLFASEFAGANLSQTNFQASDLTGANFEKANLSDVNFSEANLNLTKFDNAILWRTDLTNAKHLSGDQLSKAFLCQVKLPPGIAMRDGCDQVEKLLSKFNSEGYQVRLKYEREACDDSSLDR